MRCGAETFLDPNQQHIATMHVVTAPGTEYPPRSSTPNAQNCREERTLSCSPFQAAGMNNPWLAEQAFQRDCNRAKQGTRS